MIAQYRGKEFRIDVHDIYDTVENGGNRCIICGTVVRSQSKDIHFRSRHLSEAPRYGNFLRNVEEKEEIRIKPLKDQNPDMIREWFKRNFET